MTINYKNRAIELTKAEEKAASRYGTDAYNALREIRRDFPTFSVVVKKTSVKRDTFKGLTYDYMERYIKAHPVEGKNLLDDFYALLAKDANGGKLDDEFAESASYGEIKKWFLNQYPAFAAYRQKIDSILSSDKQAA